MTEDHQKYKRRQFLIENCHETDDRGLWIRDPEPIKKNSWIRIRSRKIHGSGSGLEKFMDPDMVNIRPDPKPCSPPSPT